jgi:hypothetical protein
MTSIDQIEDALRLARVRLSEAPEFELYRSTVAQLEYLLSVLSGVEKDRSRLKDIIIGHFAVRELAESDPEFSQVLRAAQFIASNASKGLKV